MKDGMCDSAHSPCEFPATIIAGKSGLRRSLMNLLLVAVTTAAVALATPVLAQNAPQQNRQQHSVNPSYDVYKNGRYLGSDPDPNIRASIQRGNGAAGMW
jgi:hypothetical protein